MLWISIAPSVFIRALTAAGFLILWVSSASQELEALPSGHSPTRPSPGANMPIAMPFSGAPARQTQRLIEQESFVETTRLLPERCRVVSYNIHHPDWERLRAIVRAFQEEDHLRGAHLIALQEADRGREEGSQHDVRELARALKLHYVFAAHFPPTSERARDHGVALLSAFPLFDVERIELPPADMGTRARVALAASMQLGRRSVRILTLHIQREVSIKQRVEQLEAVIQAANRGRWGEPIVILGDLNTITGNAKKEIFGPLQRAGFTTAMLGREYTFKRALVLRLALDWVFSRGLQTLATGVITDLTVSDHRPIWAVLDLR